MPPTQDALAPGCTDLRPIRASGPVGALVLALALGALACGGDDDGGGPIDAPLPRPDAFVVPACIPESDWNDHTAMVSGSVTDLVTGAAVVGAQVRITTGWDTSQFPDACPARATVTTDGAGRFGPLEVGIGSALGGSIVLFLVDGADRAPTASDQTAACGTAVACGSVDHAMVTPSAALATAWRADLVAGGMSAAATSGLVLFQFREPGATPAAGVTPSQGLLDDAPLTPGVDYRVVAADRATLAPVATTATTSSGYVVTSQAPPTAAMYVRGRRDSATWLPVGTLLDEGWWFLEDRQRQP